MIWCCVCSWWFVCYESDDLLLCSDEWVPQMSAKVTFFCDALAFCFVFVFLSFFVGFAFFFLDIGCDDSGTSESDSEAESRRSRS